MTRKDNHDAERGLIIVIQERGKDAALAVYDPVESRRAGKKLFGEGKRIVYNLGPIGTTSEEVARELADNFSFLKNSVVWPFVVSHNFLSAYVTAVRGYIGKKYPKAMAWELS